MKKTELLLMNTKFDLNNIKKIASDSNQKNIITTNLLSDEIVDEIMEKITVGKKIDNDIAWILVTGVLQRGGTNQSAVNVVTFNFNDNSLSAKELLKYIKEVQANATVRQFARSVANDIVDIAMALNIPGDLHSQMRFEHPNLSDSEAVWCSNFQTQNPSCPDTVRDWLVHNHRHRFNN